MNESFAGSDEELEVRAGRIDLAHQPDFTLGPITVQPSLRKLNGPGSETMLEPKVMQVLVALANPIGTILSREDLIDRCWEGRIVGDTSINRVISLLRSGLKEVAETAVTVENVPKVGYRLLVTSPARGSDVASEDQPAPPPGSSTSKLRRGFSIAAGLMTLLALVIGAIWWQGGIGGTDDPLRVAILPFETGESVDPIYAKGLESELRAEIARNSSVIVSTPESAVQLIAEGVDPAEIGRRLQSDYVVFGRVTNSADQVAITLDAIDVAANTSSWSGAISGLPEQASILPQRASRDLLTGIGLSPETDLRTADISQANFTLYLSAIGLIKSRDPAQMEQARIMLESVVESSPQFSQGWSGLAKVTHLSNILNVEGREEAGERAREYAAKALELDPESVEALKISGLIGEDEHERHRLLSRAVELDPGDAEAWFWLSHVAAHPEFAGEELDALVKAAQLDPLWDRTWQAPTFAASAGEFELADQLDRNTIAAAATQWQKDAAEARIKLRAGDLSEYLRLTNRAMAKMDSSARRIAEVPLANVRVLLGIVPDDLNAEQRGNVMGKVKYGILPSKEEFEESGVSAQNFFRILPIAIASPSLFIRDGRTDELLAYYDESIGSPEGLLEFAEGELRPHHLLPNMGIYLGVALREAGREEEADAMFAVAERSVARWNASAVPDMTSMIFEANLAAAKGEKTRAINAVRTLVEDLGWPYAMQSPGVALQGPLGDDPVWADLRGDPELETVLADLRATLERERQEAFAPRS